MSSERKSTLVELAKALGKGYEAVFHSSAFASLVELEMKWREVNAARDVPASAVWVQDDGVIHVDGFPEPIELVRLRRTIGNLADSLTEIRDLWDRMETEDATPHKRNRIANHLAKSHRTLATLAYLMRSSDAQSPLHKVAMAVGKEARKGDVESHLDPEEEITGASRKNLDEGYIAVYYEPGEEAAARTVADVYKHIKNVHNFLVSTSTITESDRRSLTLECYSAMTKIINTPGVEYRTGKGEQTSG